MSSGRDAQLLGDDLGERRLVALALGLHADPQLGLAGGVHAQLATVGHAQAEDVHVLARAGADTFGEERQADAHQRLAGVAGGAPFASGLLLGAQLVVAGDAHRLHAASARSCPSRTPTRWAWCTGTARAQQVLQPQLRRVDLQLVGQAVDHPLDQVHRLGDPERAGVRHTARRLVGVHAR